MNFPGVPDIEKLPHNIDKAKFFVIKSYSEADVHKVKQFSSYFQNNF